MTIDWNAFTPWSALAGGALIGLAAALFVLLNGRIAGISGVSAACSARAAGDVAWRAAFVAGLLGAPSSYAAVRARCRRRRSTPVRRARAGRPAGRRRHALRRGLHQRSRRLRAVAPVAALAGGDRCAFMGAGFATVFVTRHLFGL